MMPDMTGEGKIVEKPLLRVEKLCSGYGRKRVLNDITIQVREGDIVALLGPNGAGKSTLLKAIFGILRAWSGTIYLYDKPIHNRSPLQSVRDALSYVPQGSRVFFELTVDENLDVVGSAVLGGKHLCKRKQQMYDLFPALAQRRSVSAGRLSGGERQMLALAQSLIIHPRLLLLDEPSLGLAPQTVKTALSMIREINSQLGTTILLSEQNVTQALQIARRVYILRQGRIVLEAEPEQLSREILRKAFLGVE